MCVALCMRGAVCIVNSGVSFEKNNNTLLCACVCVCARTCVRVCAYKLAWSEYCRACLDLFVKNSSYHVQN